MYFYIFNLYKLKVYYFNFYCILLLIGAIFKISLDYVVGEISLLMQELNQNIHFFDSKSTGFSPNGFVENFQKAEKIEKFIAYVSKYKSNLFRQIPEQNGLFYFTPTTLSNIFNPYDFLYYTVLSTEQFFPFNHRYSLNVQTFVNVLHHQNQQPDFRTVPEVLLNHQIQANCVVPTSDIHLSPMHRRNLNFFVDNLRYSLALEEHEKVVKKVLKKTNTKFREYSDYIDELFGQYGDLTFVCLELGLVSGLQSINLPNNKSLNLVELKTRLLNNARNVDPLSRAIGFVGKWEWSTVKGGLYFRIVFVFPTNDLGDLNALQLALNFYWCEEITHGHGLCHHAPIAAAPTKLKKSFCHIKASNQKEREHFKERTIGYLTKSEKYYYPPELKQALNDLLTEKTSDRELSLTFRSKSKK